MYAGQFVSGGHNLFSDTPAAVLDRTDLRNVDPKLGPLQDNGGPTFTCALLPGSPAIDAGANTDAPTTDQRGVPRPQGAAPDIGAFERTTGPFVRLDPYSAIGLVGTSHTTTATLLDAGLKPMAGVPVTFQVTAGPDAGATGTTDPADGLTGADGRIRFTYDNRATGTDVLVATAALPGSPAITSLEATVLWTTLTVTNTNDSGLGSLRAAIIAAEEDPSPHTIDFDTAVTGTIELLSPLPDLSTDIILSGPGANLLTVQRDAGGYYSIFTVASGATVTLSGLTISNGWRSNGAGINNAGTLTVNNATISGNAASSDFIGGGIWNTGTLTLNSSSISGNDGCGVANVGRLTLNSSTVSGNHVGGYGAGIASFGGTLTLNSSTVSGNTADAMSNGGGIFIGGTATVTDCTISGNYSDWGGGGIWNAGTLQVRNTIIAGNTGNDINGNRVPDDLRGDLGSLGHNLIGNTSGGSGFASTDLLNVDPRLGPLQDNGGPTFTHALLPGSLAINAGDNSDAPPFDQRGEGYPRIVGGTIDIGAFEVQASSPVVADPSFEQVAVGAGNYRYDPAGSPWTFTGSAGITGNDSGFTAGNPAAPEGVQVAFLQRKGSMSQAVSGWAAGSYVVSFDAAQRGNWQESQQDFAVLVDDVVMGSFTPADTTYRAYATASFTVSDGPHTISFKGLDTAGGDNTAFVDAVTIARAGTAEPSDAGFEQVLVGAGNYRYDPAGSPWTFTGSAGITGNDSGFTAGNPAASEGVQVAFLQRKGSMSQAVSGWAAGSYVVSFYAAQRGNWQDSAQDFQVLVDDVVVSTFTPSDTTYRAYATASFTVSAGAHTITFKGLDTAGGDNTAFIDAVQIVAS
jgi:hypothetical protein